VLVFLASKQRQGYFRHRKNQKVMGKTTSMNLSLENSGVAFSPGLGPAGTTVNVRLTARRKYDRWAEPMNKLIN
jgi:hypothetical protein